VILKLPVLATAQAVPGAQAPFREAIASGKHVIVDCSQTCAADSRFFGLLLMLRKQLRQREINPQFRGISPQLRKQFWLHGVDYLLELD
jgi:N-acetylglucosaminyldiphosphoundecaprenol N-acetyl-beta-D-mannosaminyltransferase